MLTALEEAIVGARDQGTIDLADCDQRKCQPPYEREERPERSLVIS